MFRHISTASGRDIRVTPDHLLAAGACGALGTATSTSTSTSMLDASGAEGRHRLVVPLQRAGAVVVGSCVLTVAGPEEVVSNEEAPAAGLYSLVTTEALVVVNGVIASPFAGNHAAANAFYNVHRWLHKAFPSMLQSQWLHTANEIFGALIGIVSG